MRIHVSCTDAYMYICDGFRVPAASPPSRLAMVVKPSRAWLLTLRCTTTHLTSCKWWPQGSHLLPPGNGDSTPVWAPCMRAPLKFSIKAVHTASQGSLSVSHWSGHLETATLVVGALEHLIQVNKEISLVFCFSSAQLGHHPRGWRQTSRCLSLTTKGKKPFCPPCHFVCQSPLR